MIKASCCVCGSLLLVLFSHLGVALADQATKSDLAGKKICWTDGQTTFGNDGSFHSTRYMNGAWRLIGDKLFGYSGQWRIHCHNYQEKRDFSRRRLCNWTRTVLRDVGQILYMNGPNELCALIS